MKNNNEYRIETMEFLDNGNYYTPQIKVYYFFGLLPIWRGIKPDGTLGSFSSQSKIDSKRAIQKHIDFVKLKEHWKRNESPINIKYDRF